MNSESAPSDASDPETSDADLYPTEARTRFSTARVAAFSVGAVLAALVTAIVITMGDPGAATPSPIIGKVVPQLVGTTIDGEPFDIDRLRGRWVLLNLFATWCVPCQVEHPELVTFDEEHRRDGDVQVVSLVFGDTDEAVAEFFAERGGEWPVMGEAYSSFIIDLGATAVPETYVVAPSGLVLERIVGGVTHPQLDDLLGLSH